MRAPLRVLMVTGGYSPEFAGGALQCHTLIRAFNQNIACTVLSVSNDPTLAACDVVDGVRIYRVCVNSVLNGSTRAVALRLVRTFIKACRAADIVHFHGFTRKTTLLIFLARLMRKRVLLKLTSHDDTPARVRRSGWLPWRAYRSVQRFVVPSPALERLLLDAGVSPVSLSHVPNGVDVERFRPATSVERAALRAELGLSDAGAVILFVGMIAAVKRPRLLFDAWLALGMETASQTTLVFVGASRSRYHEVREALACEIRAHAEALGLGSRVRFLDPTPAIEKFYRASDIVVLPSEREGLPNVLLEAMASGLPCIASRLQGTTDALIESGVNGVLVDSGDVTALTHALRDLLARPEWGRGLGLRARQTIEAEYSIVRTAACHLDIYADLCGVS